MFGNLLQDYYFAAPAFGAYWTTETGDTNTILLNCLTMSALLSDVQNSVKHSAKNLSEIS
jgi:hypothetical protein